MKKIISSILIIITLVGCSASSKSPVINLSFQREATIKTGDFSYNALIKYDENNLYITAKSTNAIGMTVFCNNEYVCYSYKDMTKKVEKENISPYNTACLLFDVLSGLHSCEISYENDEYLYKGRIWVGDYTLKTDKNGEITSIIVDNAQIKVEFL